MKMRQKENEDAHRKCARTRDSVLLRATVRAREMETKLFDTHAHRDVRHTTSGYM